MTDIISAKDIDYSNLDEVCGYQMLLCRMYECEGGFNLPAKSTSLTGEIARQAGIWLREVKSLITSVLCGSNQNADLGDIPRLLQSYDLLHRIGNGISCQDYLREVKLRTVDRWLSGDRSISQTDVTLLLLSEIDRDIMGLGQRYVDFAVGELAGWVDEMYRYGEFAGASISETYRRLAYLMDADLSAFLGSGRQEGVKAGWAMAYLLPDDEIDSLNTLALWDYLHFVWSIPHRNRQESDRPKPMLRDTMRQDAIYRDTMHPGSIYLDRIRLHILSTIASRPDTHRRTIKTDPIMLADKAIHCLDLI